MAGGRKIRIGKNVTLVLLYEGFAGARTLSPAASMLQSEADRIAAAAGDGFEAKPVEITGGRVRARTAVVATTHDANRRQARDHILEKSL